MAARYKRTETLAVLLDHGADDALVAERLWYRVDPGVDAELGSCTFVLQTVMKAAREKKSRDARRAGGNPGAGAVNSEESISGQDDQGDQDQSAEIRQPQQGVPYRAPDEVVTALKGRRGREKRVSFGIGTEPEQQSPPVRFSQASLPSSANSSHHRNSTISLSSYTTSPSAASLGEPSGDNLRPKARKPSRKPPPTLLFSPEYKAWKKGCENIQAEHKRQQERNKKLEIPG